MSVYNYDKTASNNTTIDSIIIQDGVMRTSNVDNSLQGLLKEIAQYRDDTGGAITTTGSANAYAITTFGAIPVAYQAGLRAHVICHAKPTGASTVNWNGVGAKDIRNAGAPLIDGDMIAGGHYILEYDAANDWFELLNPAGTNPSHTHTLADITDSGALAAKNTIATADIDDDAVTLGKLAGGTADVLTGHDGSGDPSEITVGQGLALTGSVLSAGGGTFLQARHTTTGNTDGGSSTSGSWQTRTLNTEATNDISGASLATNQITLPAGTYKISGTQILFRSDNVQSRFRNTTDNATVALGIISRCGNTDSEHAEAFLQGRFTIAGTKVFELQYYANGSNSGNGLGNAANTGEDNVYADVFIEKIG